MPLSSASSRQHIHTRQVHCCGYRRDDGLWDVEGHLTDTKTYAFDNDYRGRIDAGEPVHDMWVRITVDDDLIVRRVEAATDESPFAVCPAVTPNFARLEGLSIRPGFLAQVRERLGGIEGCTHLVELMGPIATTAYQTIYPYRRRLTQASGDGTAAAAKGAAAAHRHVSRIPQRRRNRQTAMAGLLHRSAQLIVCVRGEGASARRRVPRANDLRRWQPPGNMSAGIRGSRR